MNFSNLGIMDSHFPIQKELKLRGCYFSVNAEITGASILFNLNTLQNRGFLIVSSVYPFFNEIQLKNVIHKLFSIIQNEIKSKL